VTVIQESSSSSFDRNHHNPPEAGSSFSLSEWVSIRDAGITPTVLSDTAGCERYRSEFIDGLELLGMHGRWQHARKSVLPQMLWIADALNASNDDGTPRHPLTGVLVPRRSSKTTSIVALLLGRCMNRPDYLVAFTLATSRVMATKRFKSDIVAPLERAYPDKATRPFTIRLSQGSEAITWPNGSSIVVVTPDSESFRSEAFDAILIDESGEASPEKSEDLLAGALATMDTRPDAQFIVAGTAADFRTGNLLWDTVSDGRKGARKTGVIEYSAPDTVTADDLEDWDITRELVLAAHPGIGTLTTLEVIKDRFNRLKPRQFAREYLSIFGTAGLGTSILDMEKWNAGALEGKPTSIPTRVAFAIAVHPDQVSASCVFVWRSRGTVHIWVSDHDTGTRWLAESALKHARKRKLGIVHDDKGTVLVEVEELARKRPKPKLLPQTMRHVTTAAALLVKEVQAGKVRHWNQEPLNRAAVLARKRRIGVNGWGFGRGTPEDDITSIEAAAMALRVYDDTKPQQSVGVIIAAK
jgi:hypothetical protein